jgi:hypothetical protein
MGERELEGLKSEMEKLADHLDCLNADIDAECVADILSDLSSGSTAATIIEKYGLIDDEPGV